MPKLSPSTYLSGGVPPLQVLMMRHRFDDAPQEEQVLEH